MKKILRDNAVFIFALFIFWGLCFPAVYYYRQSLYDWFVIKVSPSGYSPKVMNGFIKDGDRIISKLILDRREKDEKKFMDETDQFLKKMKLACEYYQEVSSRDEVLADPTWYEKNTVWTSDNSAFTKVDGVSRNGLGEGTVPKEFWKESIGEILSALDYYKRALNYAGPEITAAKRIHRTAPAACRNSDVIVAYSTYIYDSETYVENQIRKNTRKEEFESYPEKQKLSLVLSEIKRRAFEGSELPNLSEYMTGLTNLLMDTNIRTVSPLESVRLLERIIFVLGNSTDPGQIKNEKEFRMKRGKILYELGKKDPFHYHEAMEDFLAASDFDPAIKRESKNIGEIMGLIFEARLYTARCLLRLNRLKDALTVLEELKIKVASIDERENYRAPVYFELLQDFKVLLRETLIGLGRKGEADEIHL